MSTGKKQAARIRHAESPSTQLGTGSRGLRSTHLVIMVTVSLIHRTSLIMLPLGRSEGRKGYTQCALEGRSGWWQPILW